MSLFKRRKPLRPESNGSREFLESPEVAELNEEIASFGRVLDSLGDERRGKEALGAERMKQEALAAEETKPTDAIQAESLGYFKDTAKVGERTLQQFFDRFRRRDQPDAKTDESQ